MHMPFIAGNWKMNTTHVEAESLVADMLGGLEEIRGVEKVLCPPFVSLPVLNRIVRGSSVKLGAQNMYFEEKGAYTGEISPRMLVELCEFVILGHSERRWYFGETDEVVSKKVRSALEYGLKPILCVGERLEENEAGRTKEVVDRQLRSALKDIDPCPSLVIAYEPVWAIGTGVAASGEQAAATIKFVRSSVAALWSNDMAQDLRILYGGSVTGTNIAEFIRESEIDGALVGGASLKAEEFLSIVSQTAVMKGS